MKRKIFKGKGIEIEIDRSKMADYKRLEKIIQKVQNEGFVNQVPSNILERAISEEVGVSPATIYGYKRILLNLGFITDSGIKNKNNKIYSINKVTIKEK